jgi:hypothetical protein
MTSTLIGHPDRIEPFQNFLRIIARNKGPVVISGPVGSGKKRTVQFLIENGAHPQGPVFFIEGLQFSEEVWKRALTELGERGTLVLEGLQHLPLALQSRLKDWLTGNRPLGTESQSRPEDWRVIGTTVEAQKTWDELLFQFPLHIQLPALNEIREDIPYHLKFFLKEEPIRYLRYFFLLKTTHHRWPGNLRELEHYLEQAMAYYHSMALVPGFGGGEEVFGEKRLRYYQDILKGEWWYYPYRFQSGFTENLPAILNRTDFRKQLIEQNLVIPLLREEAGFLVLDLKDSEFESKAIRIYYLFQEYLKKNNSTG